MSRLLHALLFASCVSAACPKLVHALTAAQGSTYLVGVGTADCTGPAADVNLLVRGRPCDEVDALCIILSAAQLLAQLWCHTTCVAEPTSSRARCSCAGTRVNTRIACVI